MTTQNGPWRRSSGCRWNRAKPGISRGSLHGFDLPPPPVEVLIKKGLETRPDLAAFRLGILRARSEVRLARANRLNDVFLLFQAYPLRLGLNFGQRSATSWAVGLTVPPPVVQPQPGLTSPGLTSPSPRQRCRSPTWSRRSRAQRIQRARGGVRGHAHHDSNGSKPRSCRPLVNSWRISLRPIPVEKSEPIAIIEAQRAFGDISRQYLEALIRHRRSMFRLNTTVARVFP